MTKPYVSNAADPAQVREAARKERNRESSETQDLAAVLATREGRRFLWWMLGQTRLDDVCKEPGGSETYFALGQRNVGLILKAKIIETNERAWLEMQREQFDEARKEL